MSSVISALRRGARSVLSRSREGRLKRALSELEMTIDPSSRVALGGISPKPGGRLRIGAESMMDGTIAFDRDGASVRIGNRTFFNGRIVAANEVVIGDDVLVAWGVTIVDHNSHSLDFRERSADVRLWRRGEKDWSHVAIKHVHVGDKTWLGFGCSILPGVDIGEGAVVAACSVVTRSVPPWTLVAGNPARPIRELERDD